MSAGCGSLPAVEVEDSPQLARSAACSPMSPPSGSCRLSRRAVGGARRGPGGVRRPAVRELGEDAAGPLRLRAPARAVRAPGRRLCLGDELARPRAPRRAPRLRPRVRRTCRSRSRSSRRRRRPAALCAEGGGPEAQADAVVVAACLAEAAACGAAFVRFAGLLNGRGAEFADAVACARDRPLAG
jgi:hypothetical protein